MYAGIRSLKASTAAAAGHQGRVLKLSCLSDQERTLEAFERLSPGDSLEIVTTEPMGKLVAELQALHGISFYWWPLERGPLTWRVILAKPALDAPASVTAAMAADHLRLRELWSRLARAIKLCQIDRVHHRSVELSLGLRRHIDIEEAILFPVLEGQTQMSVAGRTEQMRTEHREIRRIVEQLDKLHTITDSAAILEIFDRPAEPMSLFERHCRKEEAALYPLMDMFNPAEERELVSLLQTFEI